MVVSPASEWMTHSWLSLIVGACSKSKRQPGPSGTVPTYSEIMEGNRILFPLPLTWKGNRILFPRTSYLKTHYIVMGQVEVGRNWLCQFLTDANFKENHQKVQLGTSLFCPEVSVHQPNQVKPTLLSHLFWTGLSGHSCYVGDTFDPLAAVIGKLYFICLCC